MTFGEKIRALRREKGWTQKELADRLSVSMRTIVSYEGGNSYPKQRELYDQLARLFGVDVNYLRVEEPTFETGQEGDREEADRLVRQVGAMFAGGRLTEEDKDAVMRALQDAYWDAKNSGRA